MRTAICFCYKLRLKFSRILLRDSASRFAQLILSLAGLGNRCFKIYVQVFARNK